LRTILHVLVATVLWVIFGIYWYIVFQQPMNPDTKTAMVSLGIVALLAMAYLSVWVFHNIRIDQRYQRRQSRRTGVKGPIQDYLGRWMVWDDPQRLRAARYIEIEVKRTALGERTVEEKIFRSAREMT
jgi:hypothetical protein